MACGLHPAGNCATTVPTEGDFVSASLLNAVVRVMGGEEGGEAEGSVMGSAVGGEEGGGEEGGDSKTSSAGVRLVLMGGGAVERFSFSLPSSSSSEEEEEEEEVEESEEEKEAPRVVVVCCCNDVNMDSPMLS